MTFVDSNLEARVRSALGLGPQEDVTCTLAGTLTILDALTGLEELLLGFNPLNGTSPLAGLTNLKELGLWGTSISDISPLSGLVGLQLVWLGDNAIDDISALGALPLLSYVELFNNPTLSDIQPLISNVTGVGAGDTMDLSGNPLILCTDIGILEARGVNVIYGACTP